MCLINALRGIDPGQGSLFHTSSFLSKIVRRMAPVSEPVVLTRREAIFKSLGM